MRRAALLLVLLLGACGGASPAAVTARRTTTTLPAPVPDGELVLPNAAVTPGVASHWSQAQVCAGKKDQRPPQSTTDALKAQMLNDAADGYATSAPWSTDKVVNHYELDHLIPLELGGAGADARNLWPEPGLNIGNPTDTAFHNNVKDGLEGWMRHQVCTGKLALPTAQHEIATDWISAWRAAGEPYPIATPPYWAGGHR